ncbi:ABC transporter permease subunit [Paracraurococcus lichenis]|uniref:ABC transporter permease subunit n=1 Tax=Paracraurococcus lichenis TaxID=3064888 RepID=A0ABT9EB62_9PROT|nr:ABC transporter permease subunit [Paracraurococcus sp. LOR1-02]MDO9713419.1 ABC transporter permease subunit [Paracraurococcus sp. LOR1-02]
MSGQSLAEAAPLRDAPRRVRLAFPRLRVARRFVAPVVLVLLWQLAAQTGLVSTRLLASPAAIAGAAWQLILSGELAYHLAVSLRRVAIGLAIALGLAVPLGLFAGLSRLGEDLVDATLQMLRALPFLALVPLLILWLGIGEPTKIALVALGAAFPIYLTLFGGIRGVDPKLLEAGRVFGLSRAGLIRHVVLPGALPQALVGLRYALGTAWLSLVVGEQINATAGIGYLVMDAREFLRTDIILVGLLVYALLGLGADQLVRLIERATLAWRPSVLGER